MENFEKKIDDQIFSYLKERGLSFHDYTPGYHVQVFLKGVKKADLKKGEAHKYYDLASLTKIIFTVSQFVKILKESRGENGSKKEKNRGKARKNFDLKKPIHQFLPWWPKSEVTAKDLLTHTSGLPWWRPLYKDKDLLASYASSSSEVETLKKESEGRKGKQENKREGERERYPKKSVREFLKKKIVGFKRNERGKCVYSDPGFWLLGLLLEELFEKSLYEIWKDDQDDLELSPYLHFNPGHRRLFSPSFYAPTGRCFWRKRELRGEVHDRNTWAFGGVAPHAGLFGEMDGLAKWGLRLREDYFSKDSFALKTFARSSLSQDVGFWGLGFMKPRNSLGGCGQFLSSSSIGHTGFTGTSFWFDPEKDLMVLILSNRTSEGEITQATQAMQTKRVKQEESFETDVYATFETKRIQKMKKRPFSELRRSIHDSIFKSL